MWPFKTTWQVTFTDGTYMYFELRTGNYNRASIYIMSSLLHPERIDSICKWHDWLND